jgi:hypothetical protein
LVGGEVDFLGDLGGADFVLAIQNERRDYGLGLEVHFIAIDRAKFDQQVDARTTLTLRSVTRVASLVELYVRSRSGADGG